MFKGVQIKRYKNRKLYAIELSKYITHGELADLFLENRGIIIRDHNTNEDITVMTLVTALASVGFFDGQIRDANLKNISDNLQAKGISVHG